MAGAAQVGGRISLNIAWMFRDGFEMVKKEYELRKGN
jgi:hypothetical protein